MRADYDSEGDTVQIDLVAVDRVDYGDDTVDDGLVIGTCDGNSVRIDVIGTGGDLGPRFAVPETISDSTRKRCSRPLEQPLPLRIGRSC